MFYKVALALFGVLGTALCVLIAARLRNTSFGIFHPLVILLALAVADAFLPAILWTYSGIPAGPEWAAQLDYDDLARAICYYLVAYALFVVGFLILVTSKILAVRGRFSWSLNRTMFWSLLLVSFCLALLTLAAEISDYGSIEDWFFQKLLIRWEGNLDRASAYDPWRLILTVIPSRAIFNLLVLVGFWHRYELRSPLTLGILFPLLAMCLALSTFFRGSVLLLLIGLAFVEYARKRSSNPEFPPKGQRAVSGRLLVGILITGVLLFLVYGVVRDRFSAQAWDVEAPQGSSVYRVLAQGSALHGLASIMKHYDNSNLQLGGKTYIDMLLLPVPRVIYTTKPDWYGIDDITRGMGWPESTQSAVTMPGEAFANFGMWGLLLMPLQGMIFGFLYWQCLPLGKPFCFLYPSVVLYMLFITSWMSFTGLVNQIPTLVCAVLVLAILFRSGPQMRST